MKFNYLASKGSGRISAICRSFNKIIDSRREACTQDVKPKEKVIEICCMARIMRLNFTQ
jgi:hypothetical protein